MREMTTVLGGGRGEYFHGPPHGGADGGTGTPAKEDEISCWVGRLC